MLQESYSVFIILQHAFIPPSVSYCFTFLCVCSLWQMDEKETKSWATKEIGNDPFDLFLEQSIRSCRFPVSRKLLLRAVLWTRGMHMDSQHWNYLEMYAVFVWFLGINGTLRHAANTACSRSHNVLQCAKNLLKVDRLPISTSSKISPFILVDQKIDDNVFFCIFSYTTHSSCDE